jgi:hypothetical protein
MEKSLKTVIETNKEYYEEWFNMEYKEIEKTLNNYNLSSLDQTILFLLRYNSTFQGCLKNFYLFQILNFIRI